MHYTGQHWAQWLWGHRCLVVTRQPGWRGVTVSAGAAAGASPASSKRRAAGLRFFGAPMTGLHLALLGAVTVLCGVKGLLPGAVVWAVYTFSQRSQGACRANTHP
jgi:hypothetical protein